MEWKTIKYNDKYEVSDTGLVRTKKTGHIHSGCIAQGYLSVKLTFENSRQKRFKIHRLVAEHFIENPDPKKKTFVNHIDGNKLNNNLENLENVSYRDNNIKAIYETKSHNYKPVGQFDKEGNLIQTFTTNAEAARAMHVQPASIWAAIKKGYCSCGYYWKHIDFNE